MDSADIVQIRERLFLNLSEIERSHSICKEAFHRLWLGVRSSSQMELIDLQSEFTLRLLDTLPNVRIEVSFIPASEYRTVEIEESTSPSSEIGTANFKSQKEIGSFGWADQEFSFYFTAVPATTMKRVPRGFERAGNELLFYKEASCEQEFQKHLTELLKQVTTGGARYLPADAPRKLPHLKHS